MRRRVLREALRSWQHPGKPNRSNISASAVARRQCAALRKRLFEQCTALATRVDTGFSDYSGDDPSPSLGDDPDTDLGDMLTVSPEWHAWT